MALALTRRAMVTVPGSDGASHRYNAARRNRRGAIADEGGIDPGARDGRHPAVGSVIDDIVSRRWQAERETAFIFQT
ncbi:hypothetical protein GCM10009552_02730 [Rothia nasimurium]